MTQTSQSKNFINDIIDKIYVINLERSKSRLENFKESFDKLNIEYEVFKAIDGYDVSITDTASKAQFTGLDLKNKKNTLIIGHQYQIVCNPENKEPSYFYFKYTKEQLFSPGLFGVYCSNRIIAEEIIKNEYRYTIICEDDIKVNTNGFTEKLANYISHLPSDFDLAYIGVYRDNDNVIEINDYVNKFSQDNGWFTRMSLIASYQWAKKFLNYTEFHSSMDNFIQDNAKSTPPSINVYVAKDDLRLLVYIENPNDSDINIML